MSEQALIAEATAFVEQVLGTKLNDFAADLKDGVLLCNMRTSGGAGAPQPRAHCRPLLLCSEQAQARLGASPEEVKGASKQNAFQPPPPQTWAAAGPFAPPFAVRPQPYPHPAASCITYSAPVVPAAAAASHWGSHGRRETLLHCLPATACLEQPATTHYTSPTLHNVESRSPAHIYVSLAGLCQPRAPICSDVYPTVEISPSAFMSPQIDGVHVHGKHRRLSGRLPPTRGRGPQQFCHRK